MNPKSLWLACSLAAVFLSPAAQAAPVTFYGVNINPAGAVSGDPVTARSAFMSNLAANVTTQTFETLVVGTQPLVNLDFTGSSTTIASVISGDGFVRSSVADGRFNTTSGGSKWWDVSGSFTLNFTGTAVSAFGFYGTDVGDFAGQITLKLTDTSNEVSTLTIPAAAGSADGGLLFFGFVDHARAYKQITFGNTSTGNDFFGFDDMVIGDLNQLVAPPTIPEPTSLALVGLALAAAGFAARRQRRA